MVSYNYYNYTGDENMIVGCLRRGKKPNHFIKTLAVVSRYYGIDFIYLNPEGITIDSNKVEGRILVNDKWTWVKADLPKFIDVKSTLFTYRRYREKLSYLSNNTNISVDKRMPLPKDKLHDAFGDDPILSKYLIPSIDVKSKEDIDKFIDKYNKVVVKPVRSNGGRNVYVISKKDSNYVLGVNKEEKLLSEKEFQSFYDENFNGVSTIAQKFILSQDKEGNPVDCRVHVEKNINGKWKNVKNYVRIGVGQKVVSNITQGGGIIDAKKYTKIKYDEHGDDVYNEIKSLSRLIPYKFEELLGRDYMTLGFDLGMDESGNLYLFEVNDNPIVDPIVSQVAMSRVGYYKYMLEK